MLRWKFILNPAKCSYQIFTNKRSIPQIDLEISSQKIDQKDLQKVLGIILDAPKLTLKQHVHYIKNDCSRRLNIMRAITSNKWGASRNLLRRVYISYIRSKIEYGCVIYHEFPYSTQKCIDVIQNNAMRIILGARKTSPILSLEIESYIMPLDLRFKYLFLKWYIKMMYSPTDTHYPEISRQVGLAKNQGNKGNYFDKSIPFMQHIQYEINEKTPNPVHFSC